MTLSTIATHSSLLCLMVTAGGLLSCTQGYVLAKGWRGSQHSIGGDELQNSLGVCVGDGVGWQTSGVAVSPRSEFIPAKTGLQVLQPLL